MSSHCSRYPNCGCPSSYGIKCKLPDDDPRLQIVPRDEKGYPLLPDGSIDWELTAHEKSEFQQNYLKQGRDGKEYHSHVKPKRKRRTNYTPPKKRNKRK